MKAIFVLLSLIYSSYCQEYTFPYDFQFGVATAAYQVEGAWNESGKGENIWDRLTHTNPTVIIGKANGDIACDTYHKTKEDVQLLRQLGVDFYRFSISWSRILPNGKTDYINPDGIRYYNELIDELLEYGIRPLVTMHHFDLPQALEDEGGFLNLDIADYFEKYAEVLFINFGDRVKDWITFNEPIAVCHFGYGTDSIAPMLNLRGTGGYECGRTLLIAHAKAYHLYRDNYRDNQGGQIGITNINFWFEPLNGTDDDDREAAEIAQQYFFGWFTDPIFSEYGDYPQVMKDSIARLSKQEGRSTSRLPEFTPEQVEFIKGTADFFGLNHYTTYYCSKITEDSEPGQAFFLSDVGVNCVVDESQEGAASIWFKVVPWGLRRALNWIKDRYYNPEVIITENGYPDAGHIFNDCRRINYHNSYLTELLKAIHEDGCYVSGYSAWSFMDSFEWRSGYTEKFGLYSVDFRKPDRPRTPKMSVYVFKHIIETRKIDWNYVPEGYDDCEWSQRDYSRVEL